MKNQLTTLLKITILSLILSMISCELNINTGDDCLECTYTTEGRVITEELCDEYGTEEEKTAMRERMQKEADELNTNLICEKH